MINTRQPNSKVELRIRCSHLVNLDVLSKSDPVVNLFSKSGSNGQYQYVGCTEKINNNLNPEFKTPILIDYFFEEVQHLKFTCLDVDGEIKILSKIDENDTIGDFETTLGNILSRPGRRVVGELKHHGKVRGKIEITAEELQNTNHSIYLRLEASNVDKKDLFGKSDPYFKIYKASPGGPQLVYQSEHINNTLNPIWKPLSMKLESFNGGDMMRQLTIEVYDYDSVGAHDLIGIVNLNTDQVLKGQKEFPIINPKKTKKSGYKNSGILKFYEAKLERQFSFLEYLAGGCEISLMVAIDCTGSNGSVSSTYSLHNNSTQPSQYARSIMSVGSVLTPYDADGFIDVLGFGGSYPGSSGVSHCFPFSFDPKVPAVLGVEGVLNLYKTNINQISFSGPTNFSEVIQYAMRKASEGQSQLNQKYSILLILTDGEISDQDETIRNLVIASTMPLSVVIVGVGSSSFENMVALDGDDGLLKDYNGQRASRDIVQFVPFNTYSSNIDLLAQETLREIPGQLLSFFKTVGFVPNPPRQFIQQPVIPISPVAPVAPVAPATSINLSKPESSINLSKPESSVNLSK